MSRDLNSDKYVPYLYQAVKLYRSQHKLVGAGKVAWTVAHSYGSHAFAFATGKFKNEFTLVLGLGLKYREGCTMVCLTPVREMGTRRGAGNGYGM
jgi:hypothetical protein